MSGWNRGYGGRRDSRGDPPPPHRRDEHPPPMGNWRGHGPPPHRWDEGRGGPGGSGMNPDSRGSRDGAGAGVSRWSGGGPAPSDSRRPRMDSRMDGRMDGRMDSRGPPAPPPRAGGLLGAHPSPYASASTGASQPWGSPPIRGSSGGVSAVGPLYSQPSPSLTSPGPPGVTPVPDHSQRTPQSASLLSLPGAAPGSTLADPIYPGAAGTPKLPTTPSTGAGPQGAAVTSLLGQSLVPGTTTATPAATADAKATSTPMSPTRKARKGWGKGLGSKAKKTPKPEAASAAASTSVSASAAPATAATAATAATSESMSTTAAGAATGDAGNGAPSAVPQAVKGGEEGEVPTEGTVKAEPMDLSTDGTADVAGAAATCATGATDAASTTAKKEEVKPERERLPSPLRALLGSDTPSKIAILSAIDKLESKVANAESELSELEACKAALLAPADPKTGKRVSRVPHPKAKHQRPLLGRVDVMSILKENRSRAETVHARIKENVVDKAFVTHDSTKTYLKPADYSFYRSNLARFARIRPFVREIIKEDIDDDIERGTTLAAEWLRLKRAWHDKQESERVAQEINEQNNLRSTKRGAMEELLSPHYGDPDDEEVHWDEVARIPDMLPPRERERRKFINNNGYMSTDTPDQVVIQHRERPIHTNPWTLEEKNQFLNRYLNTPKQFHKISAGIKNKTTQECVLYYYLSKKQQRKSYKSLVRMRAYKGRGYVQSYINGSMPRELRELGHTTTDSLASAIDDSLRGGRHDPYVQVPTPATDVSAHGVGAEEDTQGSVTNDSAKDLSTSSRWTETERQLFLDNVGKCDRDWHKMAALIGSKTHIQCRNFYQNHKRRLKEAKQAAKEKGGKGSSAGGSKGKGDKGKIKPKRQTSYWTDEEKEAFMATFKKSGTEWKKLLAAVPTKTLAQIKNYYQNYKVKLGLVNLGPARKPKSGGPGKGSAKGTGNATTTGGDMSESSESSLSSSSGSSGSNVGLARRSKGPGRRVNIESSSEDEDGAANSKTNGSGSVPMDTTS